jgi:hypothetical protein
MQPLIRELFITTSNLRFLKGKDAVSLINRYVLVAFEA